MAGPYPGFGTCPRHQEVLRRLCKVMRRVAGDVYGYEHSADCLCGESGFWEPGSRYRDNPASMYDNSLVAISWIERIVSRQIDKSLALQDADKLFARIDARVAPAEEGGGS